MENITYLTGKLPREMNYPKEVAKRLNTKGLKPSRGKEYTPNIVQNVVYGRSEDQNVRLEIISLVAEYEGKQASVKPYLDAAKAILAA